MVDYGRFGRPACLCRHFVLLSLSASLSTLAVTSLEQLLLAPYSGSIRVFIHPTMEATQNTEITVPGGTPFGVSGTNLQVWLGES